MTRSDDDADLLEGLSRHDDKACAELYHRYFPRLRELVRGRLNLDLRRRVGSDEPVQSAFRTFFRRLDAEEIDLSDPAVLEALLLRITLRKTLNAVKHHGRQRRDPRREQHAVPARDGKESLVDRVAQAREPSPEEDAVFHEMVDRLCGELPQELREILGLKLEGYTNEEIKERLDTSLTSVERKLRRIRSCWQRIAAEQPGETASPGSSGGEQP
jgi:RNA polymerase sigma factor (sigma-70 family)